MQISRNNYEEYFLLYIDGELGKADRHAVEQFVQLHPDLADELDLLKESMLPVDEMIQMPGKDQLIKQVEWKEEDITPLREDLLLYIDNELVAARKNELEERLAKDVQLNNELQSLAKTRLVGETVEMPAKEELYRSEKDRKPIPIRWTRWVAAAAAILGIGWFALSVITKQPGTSEELAGIPSTEPTTKTNESPVETVQNKDNQSDQPTQQPATTTYVADAKVQQGPANTNSVVPIPTSAVQQTIATPDERDLLENMSNPIAVVLPPTGVEDGSQVDLHKIAAPKVNENALASNPIQQSKPTDIGQASPYQYASHDETMEEENPYVNIAGAQISKQKLRSVFRNVSRTVSRSFDKSTVTEANVSSL